MDKNDGVSGPPPSCNCHRTPTLQGPDEEYDVESFFVGKGLLLPHHAGAYWLGLHIPQSDHGLWPRFRWLDGSPPPFNPVEQLGEYAHWGFGEYGSGARYWEPDNLVPPQFCVVANYSQLSPLDGIWGWSDENCGDQHAFICKIAGAHRVASLHVRWRAAASLAGMHACVHMQPTTQGIG